MNQLVLLFNDTLLEYHARNPKIALALGELQKNYLIGDHQHLISSYEDNIKLIRIRFSIARYSKQYSRMSLLVVQNIDFVKENLQEFNENLVHFFHYVKVLVDYLSSFLYSGIDDDRTEMLIIGVLDELKDVFNKFDAPSKIHINIHIQICKGIGILLYYYAVQNRKAELPFLIHEIREIQE